MGLDWLPRNRSTPALWDDARCSSRSGKGTSVYPIGTACFQQFLGRWLYWVQHGRNPLAGLLLAVQSRRALHQVYYLEAMACFGAFLWYFSLPALENERALVRIQPDLAGGKIRGCVSFIALALTAAASNVYALVAWCHGSIGCGICLKPGPDSQTGLNLLFYRDGRGGCFFCVFNPLPWPDPVNRLDPVGPVSFQVFRVHAGHPVQPAMLPAHPQPDGGGRHVPGGQPDRAGWDHRSPGARRLPSLYKKGGRSFYGLIIGLVFCWPGTPKAAV